MESRISTDCILVPMTTQCSCMDLLELNGQDYRQHPLETDFYFLHESKHG